MAEIDRVALLLPPRLPGVAGLGERLGRLEEAAVLRVRTGELKEQVFELPDAAARQLGNERDQFGDVFLLARRQGERPQSDEAGFEVGFLQDRFPNLGIGSP